MHKVWGSHKAYPILPLHLFIEKPFLRQGGPEFTPNSNRDCKGKERAEEQQSFSPSSRLSMESSLNGYQDCVPSADSISRSETNECVESVVERNGKTTVQLSSHVVPAPIHCPSLIPKRTDSLTTPLAAPSTTSATTVSTFTDVKGDCTAFSENACSTTNLNPLRNEPLQSSRSSTALNGKFASVLTTPPNAMKGAQECIAPDQIESASDEDDDRLEIASHARSSRSMEKDEGKEQSTRSSQNTPLSITSPSAREGENNAVVLGHPNSSAVTASHSPLKNQTTRSGFVRGTTSTQQNQHSAEQRFYQIQRRGREQMDIASAIGCEGSSISNSSPPQQNLASIGATRSSSHPQDSIYTDGADQGSDSVSVDADMAMQNNASSSFENFTQSPKSLLRPYGSTPDVCLSARNSCIVDNGGSAAPSHARTSNGCSQLRSIPCRVCGGEITRLVFR